MNTNLREDFFGLADVLIEKRAPGEEMRLWFSGEQSSFVRFNNAAVRQPGAVEQGFLSMELIRGQRHSAVTVALSGDKDIDGARLEKALAGLRLELECVPDDPYLLLPEDPKSTEQARANRLPPPEEAVQEILEAARGTDFVGIFASGGIFHGFASSLQQRSWFESYSFHLDFSLHTKANKAIKDSYAGFEWSRSRLESKLEDAREKLAVLDRPVKELTPGKYRVYLAPAAMEEITSLLSRDAFGLRGHRNKTSSLLKMVNGEATLSPLVTMEENTAGGVGPSFDKEGFIKPSTVTLVDEGRLTGALVSPRSAGEYGVPTTAASNGEYPEALEVGPGKLASSEVLSSLDDGIYIGNLWYLNYSDRLSCRITGMTRFGTFWIENGRVSAPTPAMRFDESLYKMLGTNLEDLTREQELILDPSTYYARATRCARLPGALVRDFTLTL